MPVVHLTTKWYICEDRFSSLWTDLQNKSEIYDYHWPLDQIFPGLWLANLLQDLQPAAYEVTAAAVKSVRLCFPPIFSYLFHGSLLSFPTLFTSSVLVYAWQEKNEPLTLN